MKLKNILEKDIVIGYAVITKKGGEAPFNNKFPKGIQVFQDKKTAQEYTENHNLTFSEQLKVVDAVLLLGK